MCPCTREAKDLEELKGVPIRPCAGPCKKFEIKQQNNQRLLMHFIWNIKPQYDIQIGRILQANLNTTLVLTVVFFTSSATMLMMVLARV